MVWGAGLTTIYNDAFQPILGKKPEALGRSFAEIWAEAWDEIGPIADRAFAGEATYIEDFPLVIDRYGRPEEAWFTFCYSPLRTADGQVAGFLDTVVETTATVQARADLALVNEELHHRLQNTLALVHAIASQSLRAVDDREAVEKFRTRIVALGRAHQVLLSKSWAGASLDEVAPRILTPIAGAERIAIAGPPVTLGARAIVSLAMVLHELATNAAIHGALSAPSGRVALSWECRDGEFRLAWRESGGRLVSGEPKPGYGWRLIDRVLEARLQGHAPAARRRLRARPRGPAGGAHRSLTPRRLASAPAPAICAAHTGASQWPISTTTSSPSVPARAACARAGSPPPTAQKSRWPRSTASAGPA